MEIILIILTAMLLLMKISKTKMVLSSSMAMEKILIVNKWKIIPLKIKMVLLMENKFLTILLEILLVLKILLILMEQLIL